MVESKLRSAQVLVADAVQADTRGERAESFQKHLLDTTLVTLALRGVVSGGGG